MNSFGNNLRITLFGESHGAAIGCTLDGLPAGFAPDMDRICFELKRRAPHRGAESTSRKEKDGFEIISGIYNGRCTGAPLSAIFRNSDARSSDYSSSILRPSHADLSARIKYNGFNDPRGGGMFSGRLTLPIVFAGALCKQLLLLHDIRISSHISKIGSIWDESFDPVMTKFPELDPFFPLVDEKKRKPIDELLASTRAKGDSIGGSVECAAIGVSAGIGAPFFDGLESIIAHILFSIPGIHGVEFGAGFSFAQMNGSDANDPIMPDLSTISNNSGGINGGISNGMPIIVRAAFRPVPSIAIAQMSVDANTGDAAVVNLKGRHDCCILPRGCAAVEAAVAIALYDSMIPYGVSNERL